MTCQFILTFPEIKFVEGKQNLNKMKLSIYSIAIMFALATISCSKESENNPQVTQKHQKVPTNQIQIEYSYDNVQCY